MSKEAKQLLWVGLTVVAIIAVVIGAVWYKNASAPTPTEALVRADSHAVGPADAAVTVVEFGDYQCPACGQAEPIVEQIRRDYANKVKFVFRNYPLSMHPNAPAAAEAAEAAAAQGKFWAMHDLLFQNQSAWSNLQDPIDKFVDYAHQAGVGDVKTFEQAVRSAKYAAVIQADQKDGDRLAVMATPTFFINGQKHEGVLNYNDFKAAIDAALAQATKQSSSSAQPQSSTAATPAE